MMLSRKRCRGTLQDYKQGEISKCQSKLWTNKNVFSCCLNGTRKETVRRDGGRLFHERGAATGKARSPRVDLCIGETTSVVVVDDRRWRRLSTSAVCVCVCVCIFTVCMWNKRDVCAFEMHFHFRILHTNACTNTSFRAVSLVKLHTIFRISTPLLRYRQ